MTIAMVAGAVANKAANGGATWTRMSWAVGLRDLGFDVHFVEQLQPGAPDGAPDYFDAVMSEFDLAGSATLLGADGGPVSGLTAGSLAELAAETELLVNISGHLRLPEISGRIPVRVYIDLDPGFTQIWEAHGSPPPGLDAHHHWFTVGENIGGDQCTIPTGGRAWRPIRQPVVLSQWPVVVPATTQRFTTIASWRGPYGPVEHDGRTYGVKAHSFRQFLELPNRAPGTFEVALDIHPADGKDRAALEEHGWRLVDPAHRAATPSAFRRYVQESAAEFSVAQAMYVDTGSGWFSDRTVRYLASGRPALVQDTGFSRNLPTGDGLFAFGSLDEATEAVTAIVDDYEHHSRAARSLAEERFAAEVVLGGMCSEVGVGP